MKLFEKYPLLREEWDFSKNTTIDPEKITYGSAKRVFWIDQLGHSWSTTVVGRVNSGEITRCPYCSSRKFMSGVNDLETLRPDICIQWGDKNTTAASDYRMTSKDKVWWKCVSGHEYLSTIVGRCYRGDGCSYCTGKKVLPGFNDLETLFPELALEWSSKNKEGPSSIRPNTHDKFWWTCSVKHEFLSRANDRVQANSQCPYCTNQKLLSGFNDFQTRYPKIALEWDYAKNHTTPDKIMPGTKGKFWWICGLNHSWYASVNNRTSMKTGCTICNKRATSDAEGTLRDILSSMYSVSNNNHVHRVPVRFGNRSSMQVDIEALAHGKKMVVEYDGAYFHKNRVDKDIEKTLQLLNSGYLVVRLREQSNNALPFLSLQDKNLLQLSVVYSKTDTYLKFAAAEIDSWLKSL